MNQSMQVPMPGQISMQMSAEVADRSGSASEPVPDHAVQQAVRALSCENLSAAYGPIQVCTDISFGCDRGEIVAVLGPNGAGKSSLFGSIAGIVSGKGSVRLTGVDLAGMPPHRRARCGLALVPEIRGNIFAVLSVDENLRLVLQGLPRGDRDDMRALVFELFPILKTRLQTEAGMLSGGEQQMLAIAMAVASKPKAMLLDEPTQGLAPAIFDILQDTLGKLSRSGLAILLAEKNIRFASRVADRYVVLAGGRLVGEGLGRELTNPEAFVNRYFPENLGDPDLGPQAH